MSLLKFPIILLGSLLLSSISHAQSRVAPEPSASTKQMKSTASGLRYTVTKEGYGSKPGPIDEVTFHYKAMLSNGNQFDNSYERNEPLESTVNKVIPGMSEGLQLMSVGAKYTLYVPSALGYGSKGAGKGKVPPDADLVFEVELLKINPKEEVAKPVASVASVQPVKRDDNRPFMLAVRKLNADLKVILDQPHDIYNAANILGQARTRLLAGMKQLEGYGDPTWPVYKEAYEKTLSNLSTNIDK